MRLDLFPMEGEHPRCAKAMMRRFILWSAVCWIWGGPAFMLGSSGGFWGDQTSAFDRRAMAAAITAFSILYTVRHQYRGLRPVPSDAWREADLVCRRLDASGDLRFHAARLLRGPGHRTGVQ